VYNICKVGYLIFEYLSLFIWMKRRATMSDLKSIVNEEFIGCVRVSKGDEIIFDASYGYADRPNKLSNQAHCHFSLINQ